MQEVVQRNKNVNEALGFFSSVSGNHCSSISSHFIK